MAALANNIACLLPDNLNKSFFLNSGAEAVESAIKVCFKSFNSKRKYILYSDKSYHGKLIGSGSVSGSYRYNNQFPSMENCSSFKFNDANDLEEKVKVLAQMILKSKHFLIYSGAGISTSSGIGDYASIGANSFIKRIESKDIAS